VARPHTSSGSLIEGGLSAGVSAAVFLGFVLAGCAYIILAKLGGMGQLYVTFVPVATMLAYALLITLARGLRLRDDQSGDNLYYMGFLFTLTSLGVSLYQFSAARAAEEIVQNFGIAIGSTIAGIGLRVIFNQMRRDPVEVERMMRLELAEAARRVRRELDSSVVEFGYFRRTAQQSAADSFNQVSETLEHLIVRFLARLEDVANKLALPAEAASRRSSLVIGELSESIGATLSASAGTLSAETEKLSSRVGAIAAALDEVASKLNAMQTPDRVIEVRLEPMAQSLAEAVEKITAQSEGQARAVKEALAIANSATERSIDLVTALRGEFDATAATNRAALEAAITMIKATADVLNEIKASSKDYAQTLGAMLEKTDETMRTFTDVLVKSGVESATRTDRLSHALPAIEARAQTLATAAERITSIVQDLRTPHPRPKPETVD
jgi:methyl-accepting chemotaxis protein